MIQITKNNQTIELRNLQEQVLKNKQDIAQHYNLDRVIADWGIKIVGQVQLATQLPDPATYEGEYGDAYAVGSQYPYNFYIWTRADENSGHPTPYWFNYGSISVVGPQGPQGNPGPRGQAGRSPKIVAGTNPTIGEEGDLYINTNNGNLYQTTGGKLVLVGNIMGPAGAAGKQGATGPAGPQGPKGAQGARGDVGGLVNIAGIVNSSDQLPLPSTIGNVTYAYLVGTSAPYALWVQVGETPETSVWMNMGPLNVATMVEVGGEFQNLWNADTKVDKVDPEEIDAVSVYAVSPENGDIIVPVSAEADQNSIARRNETGALVVSTPVNASEAVNKTYAEANFAPKTNKTSSARNVWASTGQTTGSWIRLANGGKDIENGAIPTYVQPGQGTQVNLTQVLISGEPKFGHDVATKDYVDRKVTTASPIAGYGIMHTDFFNEAAGEDSTADFTIETIEALAYTPNAYVGQWDENNEYKMDSVYSNGEIRIYEPASGEFWITKSYWFEFNEEM